MELVEHLQLSSLASFLECWPVVGIKYGVNARCLAVLVGDPSCCSALDLLNGLGLTCSVGVPYSGCILKKWANKGFVCSFLCLLVADLEVAPEKAKGLCWLCSW